MDAKNVLKFSSGALGYLALGNGDRKVGKIYESKLFDAAIYDLAIVNKNNLLKMILRIPTF